MSRFKACISKSGNWKRRRGGQTTTATLSFLFSFLFFLFFSFLFVFLFFQPCPVFVLITCALLFREQACWLKSKTATAPLCIRHFRPAVSVDGCSFSSTPLAMQRQCTFHFTSWQAFSKSTPSFWSRPSRRACCQHSQAILIPPICSMPQHPMRTKT